MTASCADGEGEQIKVAILLRARTEEALEVYNTQNIDHDDDKGETVGDI